MYVEYRESDNGGRWRMTHANYESLKAMGWEVPRVQPDSPGGLPRSAVLRNHFLDEAVQIWTEATGRDPFEASCICGLCAPAHRFIEWDSERGTIRDQTSQTS